MNKKYCIEVKEVPYKTKKKEEPKTNSFLFMLFLAVVVGILVSPDLINIRDYLPKNYYRENTNSF